MEPTLPVLATSSPMFPSTHGIQAFPPPLGWDHSLLHHESTSTGQNTLSKVLACQTPLFHLHGELLTQAGNFPLTHSLSLFYQLLLGWLMLRFRLFMTCPSRSPVFWRRIFSRVLIWISAWEMSCLLATCTGKKKKKSLLHRKSIHKGNLKMGTLWGKFYHYCWYPHHIIINPSLLIYPRKKIWGRINKAFAVDIAVLGPPCAHSWTSGLSS